MLKNSIKNDGDLLNAIGSSKGVIIYGFGDTGNSLRAYLGHNFLFTPNQGKKIIMAVSDKQNIPLASCGFYDVKMIRDAAEEYPDYPIIVAVMTDNKYSMFKICDEIGKDYYSIDMCFYSVLRNFLLISSLNDKVTKLVRKVSMKDSIWQNNNVRFYVPNYPNECIQQCIVDQENYFEADILKGLEEYIPDEAVILDIGANIGNHSMYWAIEMNAKCVYAFEPVLSTYEILEKNIELNDLKDRIIPLNIGLSDNNGKADITIYHMWNTSAHLKKSDDGSIALRSLDTVAAEMNIDKVDFVKIDVEGFEHEVLRGAEKTLKRSKPMIFIESFPDKYTGTDSILKSFGYEMIRQFDDINYLYRSKEGE